MKWRQKNCSTLCYNSTRLHNNCLWKLPVVCSVTNTWYDNNEHLPIIISLSFLLWNNTWLIAQLQKHKIFQNIWNFLSTKIFLPYHCLHQLYLFNFLHKIQIQECPGKFLPAFVTGFQCSEYKKFNTRHIMLPQQETCSWTNSAA